MRSYWSTPTRATIMTDVEIAEKVYVEPLSAEFVEKICAVEQPQFCHPHFRRADGFEFGFRVGV